MYIICICKNTLHIFTWCVNEGLTRFFTHADFQSCLICVARRVPVKERPVMPAYESFTTRQDLQGRARCGSCATILLVTHLIETQIHNFVIADQSTCPGKITSLDTSLLRASMRPGWEDLVRRCIQRFHLQNDGEMSFAKKHQQDGQ